MMLIGNILAPTVFFAVDYLGVYAIRASFVTVTLIYTIFIVR